MLKLKRALLSTIMILPLSAATTSVVHAEGLSFGFGGMAVIMPKYEGSKEYKAVGFPLVIPYSASSSETSSFGSRISFKGIDDIRFNLLGTEGFELGPVAGYRGGRKQTDGPLLGGLGDIDGGLVLGAYGAFTTNNVTLDASFTDQLTGTKSGGQVKLGLSTTVDVNDMVKLTAAVGTTYSTDKYMDNHFGVSAAQALASTASLAAYNPEAGFKDVNFFLASDIALNDKWVMKLGGKYSRLVGDAGNSPIVESKNQMTGSVGFVYKFGG